MADESRAALAISKAALGKVEADLERFSGAAYREEVSRLQLQLKEARAAALRAEDARAALEDDAARTQEDLSSRLDSERRAASTQAVTLRNELAEQSVALLSTRSEHRVLQNEVTLAKQRSLQAVADTDALSDELFPGAADDDGRAGASASSAYNSPSLRRSVSPEGRGAPGGGRGRRSDDEAGSGGDGGALFMRAIMTLIGRLGELRQQYRLTKEMLRQQSEGVAQMKALARGETANASSQAMRLQLELASRDQEAFERAKRTEQQHAAQLRQAEAAHRSVQENLAGEIRELRTRLIEAVRASSAVTTAAASPGTGLLFGAAGGVGVGGGGTDSAQIAAVMDDLSQWRMRAQNLEATVLALRHQAHEARFEHDVEKSRAAAEASRYKDELSGRLSRMSQDARAEAVRAEVNVKYRDEARAAEIQVEALRRRLDDVEAEQKTALAEAGFEAETRLAGLEASLADAQAALRVARAGSTGTATLAQERMALEQQLLTLRLQHERLESRATAGERDLEAAKLELLQVR
jgi:hypothetical protein